MAENCPRCGQPILLTPAKQNAHEAARAYLRHIAAERREPK